MSESPRIDKKHSAPRPAEAPSGCFVRLAWMAAVVAVVVLGATILRNGHGPVSLWSVAYWAFVGLAIGARYLEIAKLGGTTLEGKPATLSHWRRFNLKLVGFAAALWTLALVLA